MTHDVRALGCDAAGALNVHPATDVSPVQANPSHTQLLRWYQLLMLATSVGRQLHRVGVGIALLALPVQVAACSGSPQPVQTVTVVASATSATSSSTATTPSPGEDSATLPPSTSESIPETLGSPTGAPVLRNSGTPRTLTLADIFAHRIWEEGVYQIPASTTSQQGIGNKDPCNSNARLELRLAQATGTAAVDVAQSIDSSRSDVTLVFKLFANQRLVDTKSVRFDQVATLSASLDGVSALRLEVDRADGSECYATAVITKFVLTPA